MITRYFSRRYLRRQIVELHRQSWAGDLLVVVEEDDIHDREEKKIQGGSLKIRKDRKNSSLQEIYLNM